MPVYNKLIRDKIPEIIESEGKDYKIETLDEEEYIDSLNAKLQEELDEYLESGDAKELADLLEVIYAIMDYKGISREEMESIRMKKKKERGGFEDKLFLRWVEE